MLKYQLFQKLSFNMFGFVWGAYWRLWPVLLRIKYKQFFSSARWLKRKITIVQNKSSNTTSHSDLAAQMHEAVRLAARMHFLEAECLPKSIVLADMLRARGLHASVVIGVSKENGALASHAWVELGGCIIGESESIHNDFTTLNL